MKHAREEKKERKKRAKAVHAAITERSARQIGLRFSPAWSRPAPADLDSQMNIEINGVAAAAAAWDARSRQQQKQAASDEMVVGAGGGAATVASVVVRIRATPSSCR